MTVGPSNVDHNLDACRAAILRRDHELVTDRRAGPRTRTLTPSVQLVGAPSVRQVVFVVNDSVRAHLLCGLSQQPGGNLSHDYNPESRMIEPVDASAVAAAAATAPAFTPAAAELSVQRELPLSQ